MKRGYVASLALAAGVILVAGALIRPKLVRKAPGTPVQAAAPPPPSRRGQMRQISDFLSERGNEDSRHVAWISSARSSGVAWPDGKIVTPAPAPALVSTEPLPESSAPVPVQLAPPARFGQTGWIVIAARSSDGEPIAASGILGGVATAACGSVSVRKLVLNVPLDAAFAGGGVFDLSGDLLGTVIRCGETWSAVTHQTVDSLLGQQQGTDAVVWHDFGVRVRQPSETERRLLRLPGRGLFISETRGKSRAFNIGLRPGDLILRTGENAVEKAEDVLSLGNEMTIVRQSRSLTLSVNPAYTIEIPSLGPVLTSVQPDTRLHAVGLQAGDRIVRAEGIEDPGPTDLNRLLASGKPAWLVYEREDRRVWVLLP